MALRGPRAGLPVLWPRYIVVLGLRFPRREACVRAEPGRSEPRSRFSEQDEAQIPQSRGEDPSGSAPACRTGPWSHPSVDRCQLALLAVSSACPQDALTVPFLTNPFLLSRKTELQPIIQTCSINTG